MRLESGGVIEGVGRFQKGFVIGCGFERIAEGVREIVTGNVLVSIGGGEIGGERRNQVRYQSGIMRAHHDGRSTPISLKHNHSFC